MPLKLISGGLKVVNDQLLSRSALLEDRLAGFLALPLVDSTSRLRTARSLACLGFEHAQSVKHLVAAGLYTSAAALLRVQYVSAKTGSLHEKGKS